MGPNGLVGLNVPGPNGPSPNGLGPNGPPWVVIGPALVADRPQRAPWDLMGQALMGHAVMGRAILDRLGTHEAGPNGQVLMGRPNGPTDALMGARCAPQ